MLPRWPNLTMLMGALSAMRKADQLRIFMHPQYLVLARMAGGNTVARRIVACHPLPDEAQPDQAGSTQTRSAQPWSAAVAALGAALQSAQWQGAAVQLVLSSHFVRYALIPWHADLAGQAERQAFLRHSFLLHYGDAASSWDLRMSDAGIHQQSLASGTEQALLHELQHSFSHAGVTLESICPHLMVAVNHSRPWLSDDCWLVVVESGRACVALLHKGQWLSVKSFALAADDAPASIQPQTHTIADTLSAFVQREAILCAVDAADWPLVVYWPGCTDKAAWRALQPNVIWAMPAATIVTKGGRVTPALATSELNDTEADYQAVLWA